jgi:hypothetical protein
MRLTLALAALLATTAANAQTKMQWVSGPILIGQGITQQGNPGTIFHGVVIATTEDAQGNYEAWVDATNEALADYAGHAADQLRAACNKTGDNSCFANMPQWKEITVPGSYVVFSH